MSGIRLELLGGFAATTSSGVVIPVSSKKGRALLAYLALQEASQRRERLAGLLWSDRDQPQAQNSLRHELVELRRALDGVHPPPLEFSGDTVGFAAGALATDVAEFERALQDDTVESLGQAARLYRGPLLDMLPIRDLAFDEWLMGQRARLHDLAIMALDRLANRLSGDAAIQAAKSLLALDPLREASHRVLMNALAMQGEHDLALRQYQECRRLLRQELDVAPSAETEVLHRKIRNRELTLLDADAALSSASELRPAPVKASLAILPFEALEDDATLFQLAAGLAEEVTTGLARFRLVSVVSRHLTQGYRGRAVDMRQVGQQLGARYVLTGTLRRSGKRMRAAAQLVEVETGRELWSERYDRALIDAFALQDELTQAIIAQLEHVLVAAEHRRAVESGIGEQEILNQKAGWHLFRFTREDNARAIDLLRRAIAQNPDADRRYQGLALALGLELAFGWSANPGDTIVEMLGAAERSVSLREGDAWNHATLSWSLMYARQFGRAVASCRRMIELNPNSGVSYGVSAVVHAHCEDAGATLEFLEQARRMAPQAPFMFNYLTAGAIALYRLQRFEECAEMAESASLRRPNYFQPHFIQAAALSRAGDCERAKAELQAAARIGMPGAAAGLRPLIPLRAESDLAALIEALRGIGWAG